MQKAAVYTCWLAASAGCGTAETTPPVTENNDSTTACVTLDMGQREAAVIDMAGNEALLEIPGSLELRGQMAGGVVVVDFNRPQFGKLACEYEQEDDGALTLRQCDEDATRGSWVTSDRMSLRLKSSQQLSEEAVVTACAAKQAVPGPIPEVRPLEDFRVLPNGDVLRPQGDGEPLASDPVPFGMTGELEQEYRAIAVRDANVKALLGQRFAYSYLDTIDPPKGQERDSVHVKLYFFSHSNNGAVWAEMRNAVVQDSGTTDLSIPEGADEIEQALELARRHPALAGRVNDLFGGGMVKVPVEGAPWTGDRVLEVHFGDADHVAQYRALVDLTNERVLEAGPVGER